MPTRSISDVLQHTNRQIATDLHDKVYAIMGFLSEETRLIPDYSLSVEDLFLEVARTALRAGDLSILRSAGTLSKRTLPSWVPDWSIDFNDIPEPIFRREHNFTSSGDSEAILAWSENKKLLGVRVTFIDNLDQGPDTLLPFPILENPWYGSPELKREWAQKTGIFIGSEWKLSSRCLPAVGPAAIEESLWRALTMESMGNGFPADNSFGKYFKIFFRDLKWHWIIEHGHLG
ncbi:MAG: hypothetical protein MMC33_006442 [Icmadophila ericetorum]|nr:hypothetical protein [Icmadophila ericetorum]